MLRIMDEDGFNFSFTNQTLDSVDLEEMKPTYLFYKACQMIKQCWQLQ